jgi:hypothetical protein
MSFTLIRFSVVHIDKFFKVEIIYIRIIKIVYMSVFKELAFLLEEFPSEPLLLVVEGVLTADHQRIQEHCQVVWTAWRAQPKHGQRLWKQVAVLSFLVLIFVVIVCHIKV